MWPALTGFLLFGSMAVAVVLVLAGAVLLALRPSDKWLAALSLLACVAALAFAPILRSSSDEVAFPVFFGGFFPVAAIIAFAVIASAVRWGRTRRWAALPAMVLSAAAAGLFYINLTTPWLWPYRN